MSKLGSHLHTRQQLQPLYSSASNSKICSEFPQSVLVFYRGSFKLIRRRICRLAKDAANSSSVLHSGNLTEQRNILRTRLRAWELLLPVYMPGLVPYQTTEKNSTPSTASQSKMTASHPTGSVLRNSANPEDTDVWLPSRIPLLHRSRVCQQGLVEIKDKIRMAQCFDTLEAVRHVLRIKTCMVASKNKNVRGQRQSTQSRMVIDRVHERARQAAEKYRILDQEIGKMYCKCSITPTSAVIRTLID